MPHLLILTSGWDLGRQYWPWAWQLWRGKKQKADLGEEYYGGINHWGAFKKVSQVQHCWPRVRKVCTNPLTDAMLWTLTRLMRWASGVPSRQKVKISDLPDAGSLKAIVKASICGAGGVLAYIPWVAGIMKATRLWILLGFNLTWGRQVFAYPTVVHVHL